MSVTAKVILNSRSDTDGQAYLSFSADYADERNKEWAKYTPSLSVSMTVKGAVAEHFQPGQSFTLTFTPEARR